MAQHNNFGRNTFLSISWCLSVSMFCLCSTGTESFTLPTHCRNSFNHDNAMRILSHEGQNSRTLQPQLQMSVNGVSSSSVTSNNKRRVVTLDQLKELNGCESGTKARRILKEQLLRSGGPNDDDDDNDNDNAAVLYGAVSIPAGASERGLSDSDLAIQTKFRGRYSVMELIELNGNKDADRASLAVLGITIGSVASALVANENMPGPEIVRFAVVWLFSFAPLAFVGYGIATPDKLQALLVSIQRNLFPSYRVRMTQHEAGHFLMGHLLGLPIKGYAANAIKNAVEFYPLSDQDVGRERISQLGFDQKQERQPSRSFGGMMRNIYEEPSAVPPPAPYYSDQGRGAETMQQRSVFRNVTNPETYQVPEEQNDPLLAWPYRGFDPETIDRLTAISVAGVCAELLAFGNAEGGLADFNQLEEIFNRAEPALEGGRTEKDNRIRFAIGYTMSQLRLHLGALDALAEIMQRDGTVAECVVAIENCPNISGQDGKDGILGVSYELRRRQTFLSEEVSFIEKVLLGETKNADMERNDLVEGKGGGYKKEEFRITGDDPLYLAVGAATLFLLWATAGGITL